MSDWNNVSVWVNLNKAVSNIFQIWTFSLLLPISRHNQGWANCRRLTIESYDFTWICGTLPIFAGLTRNSTVKLEKSRSWTIWCWKVQVNDFSIINFSKFLIYASQKCIEWTQLWKSSRSNLTKLTFSNFFKLFLNCGCYSFNYLVLNWRAFFNNGRLFRKFGLFAFSYFDGEKELGLSSFRRITLFLDLIQEKLETRK